jgi:valyl-tRNA synthetase
VTEEVWQVLGETVPASTDGEPLLVRAGWPAPAARDASAESDFDDLSALVRGVRNLRTDAGLAAGSWIPLVVQPSGPAAESALADGAAYLETLARVRPIEVRADGDRPPLVAASPLGAAWLGVDASAERAVVDRRAGQLVEMDGNIARLQALLADAAFVAKAPPAVVERERQRLADLEEQRRQLGGGPA